MIQFPQITESFFRAKCGHWEKKSYMKATEGVYLMEVTAAFDCIDCWIHKNWHKFWKEHDL